MAQILRRVHARHEAAHAVVAHMFGIRVEEIALDSDNRKITANPCGGGETYTAVGTWRENTLVALAGRVESRRQLQHLFGGRRQHQDEPSPFPSPDEKRVALCLRYECDRDPEKVRALFRARYEEARALVEKHDSQIGALAEALLDNGGFLVEAQILQILGPYPEVSSQTLRERERAHCVLQGDPEWDEIL